MNSEELMRRMIKGSVILVGEYRNGRAQTKSAFDKESGEKIEKHEIVYAVERENGFGLVLIYRSLPSGTDLTNVQIPLIKGTRYAFELSRFSSGTSGATAQLGSRDPEVVE